MTVTTHHEIIERLCEHGFVAYTVGGAVRDMLMGVVCSDFDVATSARPEQIEELFADCDVRLVGKSFGVVLVNNFEVATFRKDRHQVMFDARQCEVSFADHIEDDLCRRDFTINALALCEVTGDLIDFHSGREDLCRRLIRFVGNPTERIHEDPVRIIRACRFLAKLEGEFAHSTLVALRENAHLVEAHVAPERIRLEILKSMSLKTPSLFWGALELIGVLKFIFPEMSDCVNHGHGNHHKENVWEHMMLAGDHVSPRFPLIRLAAFLHDVGKPKSFNPETGQFLEHELIGREIVRERLTTLKFSTSEIEVISGLVRHHMHSTWNATRKTIRKIKHKLSDSGVSLDSWFRMKIADRAANINKSPFTVFELVDIKRNFDEEDQGTAGVFNAHALALSGGQIIERFNLTPGPIVGIIQRKLVEFVIENGFDFNTVEALSNHVDELLKENLL